MPEEPTPHHTTEPPGELVRASAAEVVESVMAVVSNPYAIPGAYVAGKAIDAVSNIVTAKINANVELTQIHTDAGHPEGPGAHEK